MMKPAEDTKVWRAFYTKPRHEIKASARLADQNIETYCPTFKAKVKWSDRWKKVTKPLFNGYVFAKVDERERIQVLEDPSISYTVMYVGKPACIRSEEIEAIQMLMEDAETVELRHFEPGEKVKINDGPLSGRAAELIDLKNGNHAILRIEALGTEIHVTLNTAKLEKLAG